MANQKSIIIENAQKFALSGKIDKAIAEWKKLLIETPQDGNIYNNIADLYLRTNDKASAIDACLKAASTYREAGFELKGVAVLKKILKIDTNRIDIYEMLADMNADRGLTGNAVEGYQQTAKLFMKNGNFKGAIGVYQKLIKFSPGDPEIPLTIARLYQKQERFREAIFSYEQAEAIYESKNMVSEAHQVLEEIIKISPSYLSHLVEREAAVSAIGELSIERDITLAPPKPSPESSKFAIKEIQEEPFFSDEMEIFRDLIPEDMPAPAVASFQKPIVEDVLAAKDQNVNKPFSENNTVEVIHRVSDTALESHLSEAASYIKYGLNQNAIEKLILITELVPDREDSYIQLKELYLKEGQKDQAAIACVSLANIYEKNGDFNKKEAILSELHEIDPNALPPHFPPLLDEVEGNPFLQAEREIDFGAFLPEELDMQVQSQEESFDLGSAITEDLGNLSVNSLAIRQDKKMPILADPVETIQNGKKQQYLETCYHLGIAQKEMGNFAKAIREFEQALDGEGRFQEVLSLLAGCYAEQGELVQSATVLKKGSTDPRCKEGSRFPILYDLASIYSQLGENEKAFLIYKEIHGVTPNFRDVSDKMKEITFRKFASESIIKRESIPFSSEAISPKEKAAPVLREKRRISYV